MERLKEWVKAHPRLTVALVAGFVILFYLVRKGNAAAAGQSQSNVYGTGLSESGYLTLQGQQLQAAMQNQALQAQQNGQVNQLDAQLQVATLNDQLGALQSNNQLTATLAQIVAQQQVTQGQTDASVQIAKLQEQLGELTTNNTTAVQLAQIQAQQVQTAQMTGLTNTLATVLAQIVAGQQNQNLVVPNPSPATGATTTSSVSPIYIPPPVQYGPSTSPTVSPVSVPYTPPAAGPTAGSGVGADPGTSQYFAQQPIWQQIAYDQTAGAAYANNPTFQSYPGANPYWQQQQDLSNLPGVSYTFANVTDAVASGIMTIDPTTGRPVCVIAGCQVTY